MEVSIKAPTNKKGQDDLFLITDADMEGFISNFLYFTQDFERKFKKSIFHKYFLKSIDKVNEDKSRQGLLLRLQHQLDTGIYHFPISDVDPLYQCIFETLPKLEQFRNNSILMDELFLIMNIFMFRFYDAAFPFFYDFTAERNIFTYGLIFVINYFRQFSIRFDNKSVTSDKPYLQLLEQDGSLTNILNYLFDQYTKGVELPLLSDCISRLMRWINCHFLRDYLTQNNFFKTGTSILINSNIKLALRMDFLIAFYMNYFENHYEKVSTPFLIIRDQNRKYNYEEELPKKEVIAQEIINDINDLKVKNFLESYLSSYVDQLIKEGRLLNTVDPLGSRMDNVLNGSMSFYPLKAEDKHIFDLFDLLVFMFRFVEQDEFPDELYTNYQNCIFDFIPIISTICKVIPGVFLTDWIKWTIFLFDKSRESNSNVFETLRDTFLEIIQMRISGDFLLNLDCKEMIRMVTIDLGRFSGPKEIIREINQDSISIYAQILFTRLNPGKDPFVDDDLFFSKIRFSSLDSTIDWFNTVIKRIKIDDFRNISRATITYLGNVSTEPKFIECVLNLFQTARFYDDDYRDLNEKGIIPYFFKLFIETPDLQNSILPTKFFSFCDSIGKYIIDNDSLIEEALNVVIETNDIFRFNLLSIVLNYGFKEKYQSFVKQIVENVISKSMKITQETINEQIIKQIISISPFLTTIKFNGNNTMFNILKASLDYLNMFYQSNQKLIIIDKYHDKSLLKFDPLVQSKVNIVYALANSFGFAVVNEFLGLINNFLNGGYGMCIEVLNVIANIIGFLVEHIEDGNILSEISTTNETIFKIMNILIENTPENSINFNLQHNIVENPENKGYFDQLFSKVKNLRQKRRFEDSKSIIKFALYPIDDDDEQEEMGTEQSSITRSCFYSFRMKGHKVDDTFGYTLENQFNFFIISDKKGFKHQSKFTVKLLIRNITNYVINMLKIFGIKPETITLFKKIIMISIKNGLIQVPALETFLDFVADNPDFFTSNEEANNWILGLVERSSFLMISSKLPEKYESRKLEIGDKKEQLKLIFLFFYNMNQNIFPGCLTEELINVMFKYSPFSQESFLDFINSDEDDMDIRLNEFLEN